MRLIIKSMLVASTIFAILIGFAESAKAQGEWANGDLDYWTITRVCRDGAEIEIIYGNSTDRTSSYEDIDVNVQPRLITREFDASMVDDFRYSPFPYTFKFFPKIAAIQQFYSPYSPDSATPYRASPFGRTDNYYHYFFGQIHFSQEMPVGSTILIVEVNASENLVGVVENCYLGNLVIAPGDENIAVDAAQISAGPEFLPRDALLYKVVSAPTQGKLQLDDVPLTQGSTFTETALLSRTLRYLPDSLTDTDSFTYTARATFRASINSLGEQAVDHLPDAPTLSLRGGAGQPSISADGSAVAFTFEGVNLFVENGKVITDTDPLHANVYRHDLYDSGRDTTAVSVTGARDALGALGNAPSSQPAISWDGTTVAYVSLADNLLMPDARSYCKMAANGVSHLYVSDFFTKERRSTFDGNSFSRNDCTLMSGNTYAPAVGGDASDYVVAHTFTHLGPIVDSDENRTADVFLSNYRLDAAAQSTSRSGGFFFWDGNKFIFSPGSDVSTGNGGSYNPDISADGRFIAFESDATYLGEGLALADTNGERDIMLRPVVDPSATDTFTSTFRISLTSENEQAMGGGSFRPAISRFGNHIAFESEATNLMPNHNGFLHVYVRDRQVFEDGLRSRPCTVPLSLSAAGEPANGHAYDASISADGRFVAFQSEATNLVEGDTNGVSDIFVVDRDADGDYSFYGDGPDDVANCTPGPRRLFRVSIASSGTQANGASREPDISGNGDFVAFTSAATNLVADDMNGIDDVFVHYIGFTGEVRFQRASQASQVYLPVVQQ